MKLNKHGFSLIEVMITVGILSIIALGTATMFSNMLKSQKDIRAMSNRDYVVELVKHFAGSPAAIARSATEAGNADLNRCLGVSGGTCTGNTLINTFTLYDSAGTPIAGPSTAPIRYTIEGARCPGPASVDCPLEAIVWIVPVCSPVACTPNALRLDIHYMIRKAAGVAGLSYRFSCTLQPGSPAPPAGTTCPASMNPPPPISIAIPLNNPNANAVNRLGYWSSTTGLSPSTARQDSTTGNLFLNESLAAPCNALNAGGIRTRNGALEVCDGALGLWKNAGGAIDSSVSTVSGYPNLKNLYLCPAGGDSTRCGGASVCMGQVSKMATCCMDRPPLGALVDAACSSLY